MAELKNLEQELDRFRARLLAAALFVLLASACWAGALVYLQVMRHDELAHAGRGQPHRRGAGGAQPRPDRRPQRRRAGQQLLGLHAGDHAVAGAGRAGRLIDELAEVVDIRPRDRRRFKRLQEESKSFESLPIRTKLSDEEVARFMAQRFRFPGVDVKARLFRNYPLGDTGSHLLGYIGRINQPRSGAWRTGPTRKQANYRGTEYIGKLGLEQAYEPSCTAPPASRRSRPAPAAAPCGACAATRPRRATSWCCRSTSGCRPWSSSCSATAAARWWPSTRATARCWPSSASPPSTPTCSSTASTRELARAQREHRQAAAQPGAARHLPAGLDLQALHGDGRADSGKRGPSAPSSTTAAPSASATTSSAATATTAWAGGHVPLDRQVQQRLLLLAGQRDGRGPDARAAQAVRLRPQDRHRPRGRGHRRAARPPTGRSARPTRSPSSRSGMPARPSRWASARATTTSPCCRWPAPRPRWCPAASASSRGWCARSRTWSPTSGAPGQRRAAAAAAQARARGALISRAAGRDAGRHVTRVFAGAAIPAAARPAPPRRWA
jgi:hypothetical protein